jgi:hypothetical protein
MTAGKYSINAETVWGTPYKLSTTSMLTADGLESYEFIVTAEVTSISTNSGGNSGNRLTINGTGFGTDDSVVTVDVAGIPCSVISVSYTEIVCDL